MRIADDVDREYRDTLAERGQMIEDSGEPLWLTAELVKAIHERQLSLFGGPAGIRDEGALESALVRPVNRWAYEQARLAGACGGVCLWLRPQPPLRRRQQAGGAARSR